jgi:hypothetical protein
MNYGILENAVGSRTVFGFSRLLVFLWYIVLWLVSRWVLSDLLTVSYYFRSL